MAKLNWDAMYELAKIYYEKNNNLKIPATFITTDGYTYNESGIKLGRWICNLRTSYKNQKLTNDKIEKLNEIGMIWRIEFNYWEDMYILAQNYYNYHKNLKIEKNFKTIDGHTYDDNGIKLGLWINKQRVLYKNKKLSQGKVKKLNEIKMIWNMEKNAWDKMYDLAAIYYFHHHNLQIPRDFKTKNGYTYDENGIKLGIWISNQRQIYSAKDRKTKRKYKTLTPRQICLLEQIGMIWDASVDYEQKWDEMYKLALKYYKYHKDLNIPVNFKTIDGIKYSKNGVNLGSWINKQRLAHRLRINGKKEKGLVPLSDERTKLLEEIGMIWDVYDANWYQKYELAKKYYNKNGNLEVQTNFKTYNGIDYNEKGFNLYNWIKYQRRAYKEGNSSNLIAALSSEQIELLEEIGMVWENPKNPQIHWLKMYKLAYIYYENYGNLDIKGNFKTKNGIDYDKDGYSLGRWIRNQRENYKKINQNQNSPIKEEQIELLNEIGMIWQKQEIKPRFSKINPKSETLEDEELYKELIAKIRFLNIYKIPLVIENKPNPIFYMSEGELIKNYNMNIKELIDKYYSETQSTVVLKKIKEIVKNK